MTVFTHGDASFDDGTGNAGTIGYGGVEWMRAGRGVWHGKELGARHSKGLEGFQLFGRFLPNSSWRTIAL